MLPQAVSKDLLTGPPDEDGRFRHARLYWNTIRGDRRFPARRDYDPVDVPCLLPFTALIEVCEQGRDFRYRLIGTAIDALNQGYHTGQRLSTIRPEAQPAIRAADLRRCCEAGQPIFGHYRYNGRHDGDIRALNVQLLPFGEDDDSVNLIWALVLREFGNERIGRTCIPRRSNRSPESASAT